MNEVRISHAWCVDHLVAAADLTEGGLMPDCLCLGCGEALIARIGSGVYQKHFAHQTEQDHQPGEWRCNQRSLCTRLGGHFVRRRVHEALTSNRPLEITWRCPGCGQIHRQNLLRGVHAVSEADSMESSSIELFGQAQAGEKPTLEAVLAVGFMRENEIPAHAKALARAAGVSLWLLSASSPGTAAQLGDEQAGPLDAVATFQVPCYRPPPKPPPAPPPPPEWFDTPRPLLAPGEWPAAAKRPAPTRNKVLRLDVDPPTFPLPIQPEEFGCCLHCHGPLARRYLCLHTFPTPGPNQPGPVMALVIYRANEWLGAGWEDLSEAERMTALLWGADAEVPTYPSRLANLASLFVRAGRETLGSYSCWCPRCKQLLENLP